MMARPASGAEGSAGPEGGREAPALWAGRALPGVAAGRCGSRCGCRCKVRFHRTGWTEVDWWVGTHPTRKCRVGDNPPPRASAPRRAADTHLTAGQSKNARRGHLNGEDICVTHEAIAA